MGERVATVEEWQKNHEVICAQRWGLVIKMLGWGGSSAFLILLAVAGFGLREVYTRQSEQLMMLRQIQVSPGVTVQ